MTEFIYLQFNLSKSQSNFYSFVGSLPIYYGFTERLMTRVVQRGLSWLADVRRKGHKSISKSFPTKGKAQVWAREIEAQIDALQFNDARSLTGITVAQLIERYIQEIGGLTPFRYTKTATLNTWIRTHGHLTLAELTADCLIEWTTRRAKDVTGATIAVDLAYLGVVLKTAKELWRLPVDDTMTGTPRRSLKYLGVSAKGKRSDRHATEKTEERISPITEGTPHSLYPQACKELGIVDMRFHDLRHEGVSRFFEQKYSIEQVALLSGHRDWKMLARYTQVKAKDLHRA